ncbi:MAG TPA: TonB-dependent receptor [Bryobacteraceae bacterium]|jgi:hypothetical protein|nr:TonB-dependent receptor [Bryobacteraceae bacterium]
MRFQAVLFLTATCLTAQAGSHIAGQVTDTQGNPVAGARLRLSACSVAGAPETTSGIDGRFEFAGIASGRCELRASAPGFAETGKTIAAGEGQETATVNLQFTRIAARPESITVTADARQADIQHPDPARQVSVREEVLDANPGRPGVPVSIPGLPAETASGGIKAPQYFAPGVAGDHGEPVAQFLQAGSYLVPNNLSANAHGNGYSDPNVMIPAVIESVQTDGGAFDVREGNHAVNLAVTYGFRQRVQPFVMITGDARDVDVAAGWSPAAVAIREWFAVEASYGNGLLDLPEHRQQYKTNAFRVFDAGRHQVTLLGIGYYGQSRIPGLVPIDVPNLHDTIDPRQRGQTHTGEIAANDVWRLSSAAELQFSGFFRTYNLSLYSNFGDGLIRQSEFRTVTGGNTTYVRKLNRFVSLLAGADALREAPRRLDLDRYDSAGMPAYGPFRKVTANNVTINSLASYVALDGWLLPWLHYNAGWRRDQIGFENADLLIGANSYHRWAGVNSPKASITLAPPDGSFLPTVSLSFGQTFFTNDPRIGTGVTAGTPVSRAHAYQLVVRKSVFGTDLRLMLGRVTQEQSLARIDPDTGLQYDQGPGRNRYITLAAHRYFRGGSIQASVSKADARDLSSGAPIPEAPRLIFDVSGTLDRLPWHLQAQAEYEEVGRKPLGDGFMSVPVREFRGRLFRQFTERFGAGVQFLLAAGYTGQTTEVLALPGEGNPTERVTGVYLPSYASVSVSYRFGRMSH